MNKVRGNGLVVERWSPKPHTEARFLVTPPCVCSSMVKCKLAKFKFWVQVPVGAPIEGVA